jgi:superfamily II DNA or RNA helicase
MKELAYSINSQETLKQGMLVLDLYEAHKENFTYKLSPCSEGKTAPQWRSLARSPADQEVFSFLLKTENDEQRKKTGRSPQEEKQLIKQFHVPLSQVNEAWTLLAPTQKCFFKDNQLIIDVFGAAELYYEAKMEGEGKLAVNGRIRWRDRDIALSDCAMVGPGKPHWFIYGITLKTLSTHISWKKLQEMMQSTRFLEGPAKQTFLDDIDPEDLETPQLIFLNTTKEIALVEAIPYPILILKDRWGSFADLWMDYGNGIRFALHDSQSPTKTHQGKPLLKRQEGVELGWEKDLLETDYLKKIVDDSHYYCPMDKVAKSLSFLLEVGWHIEDARGRRLVRQTGIKLNFELKPQALAVQGKLYYESHEADVKQVIGAFNRKEKFLELSKDTIGLVPFDNSSSAIQELAEEGEIVGGALHIKKSRFNALAPLWEYGDADASLANLKEKCQNFHGIETTAAAPAFEGILRPYQQEGLNWLSFLTEYGFNGILADEMGLGKTVQILAFLSTLSKDKPHLVVVPTSLLFNWKNEISRFLPSYRSLIHQGPLRAKSIKDIQPFDIVITSYATLRIDLALLQELEYGSITLDEAQTIKNASTQTFQAVQQLKGGIKISITGTPIENHLGELWSHFHFLMPDLLGSKEQFDADVEASQADRRYIDKIKRKIFPFILRRLKKDVAADLPPRIDQVVWIEMDEEQRKLYDRLVVQFKGGLLKKVQEEGISKHRLEILEAILRLRQVCCDPLLLSSYIGEESMPKSSKLETLFEELETIVEEGHKVLVYSQFTSMLKLMAQRAQKKKWSYGYLDGSTLDREKVVNRFQEDPSQSIFFISLKAGGVGLNLTAADYVYLYDPWWNEAVEEQAINRAHRIGREDPVIAKRLVILETIEEKMMKLKAAKRMLIDEIFDPDLVPQTLTLEDLHALLS